MQETQVQSLGWEDPPEKEIPTQVFLPREFHGQGAWWATVHEVTKSQVGWHHQVKDMSLKKLWELVKDMGSLVCCSPWDCKESDTA